MKIVSAVLEATGAARPYAQSLPLALTALDLDAPGPGELLVRIARDGAVPFPVPGARSGMKDGRARKSRGAPKGAPGAPEGDGPEA